MLETLRDLYVAFFGASVFVAPEYLVTTLALAFSYFRFWRKKPGFWSWIFPKKIYGHASHRLDLKLFFIGRFLVFFNILGRLSLTTIIAAEVARIAGPGLATGLKFPPILLAFLMWLVLDFATYWSHRIQHQSRVLWPLHAVHHSAKYLTPFSAYRQHPLAYVPNMLVNTLIVGLGQGVLIGAANPETLILEIASINAFLVLANLLLTNFHHSHIWISFGPLFEHLVISPAQHQIHHSKLPRHFNKNYGHSLALWDWIFGTLYVIRGQEYLELGIDESELAVLNSHRLWPTLVAPLRRMKDVLRRSRN